MSIFKNKSKQMEQIDKPAAIAEQNTDNNISHVQYGVDVLQKKMNNYMDKEVDITYCMDDIKVHTNSTKEELNAIHQVVDKMNDNYQQFNEYAAEITDAMNQSDETVKKVYDNMEELAAQIENSKGQLSNMVTTFEQVEQDFSNITSLTNSITGISSRTNLLALNASIEAARAGEAGKGFAVVAEQIRELSSSTASLVKGIEESVSTLHGTLENLQQEISKTSDIIQGNVEYAYGVKENFGQIQLCTNQVKEVSGSIVGHIADTNRDMESARQGVDATNRAIETIEAEVSKLNEKSSRKLVEIGEVIDLLQQLHNILYDKKRK